MREISLLGESMSTGKRKDLGAVDQFLGQSLSDSVALAKGRTQAMNYVTNMVSTTQSVLDTTAEVAQRGLGTVSSAAQVSEEKLQTLEQNLESTRDQIELLIQSANFDGKSLLNGDVSEMEVQVGRSSTDKMKVSIKNLGDKKVFRSEVLSQMTRYLAADASRSDYYKVDPKALVDDLRKNENC